MILLYVAGQRICSGGEGKVAGKGTYVHNGCIHASLVGYVTRNVVDDKMVFTYFFLCLTALAT